MLHTSGGRQLPLCCAQAQIGIGESMTEVQQRFEGFREDFEAGGGPAPYATVPLTSLPVEPPVDADKVRPSTATTSDFPSNFLLTVRKVMLYHFQGRR